jgi:hypothetical protein
MLVNIGLATAEHVAVLPDTISAAFDGKNTRKRKARIAEVLDTLVATGSVRTALLEGQTRYFVPR